MVPVSAAVEVATGRRETGFTLTKNSWMRKLYAISTALVSINFLVRVFYSVALKCERKCELCYAASICREATTTTAFQTHVQSARRSLVD